MKILRYIILILVSLPGISSLSQVTFFADTTEACDSLTVIFSLRSTGPDPVSTVEWDFGNGETASGTGDQTVTYTDAGAYTVSILVDETTSIDRPGYIKVHSTPAQGFQWSDSLELGSFTVSFLAAAQPVDSVQYAYDWLLEPGISGDTRSLIHRFSAAGDYPVQLRVTHPFGCESSSMRLVTVRDSLDCPNVFTPNDDGINDYFIVNSNGVTIYNIQIFSTSGILVYKAEAPTLIWDGRNLSGQEMHPGTYYYIIRPAGSATGFEKKGFVKLFR